jgi:hypothetical protein
LLLFVIASLRVCGAAVYASSIVFRARVANGRLVLDEPTDLPEGLVLNLVVDDEGDDLDDAERVALHAAIDESRAEIRRGEFVTAEELLASLRKK